MEWEAYARQRVQHARPAHDQAHARPSAQVAVRAGRVGGALLVAEGQEADPRAPAGLGHLDDRDADQAEHDAHAEGAQGGRDKLGPVRRGGRHCRTEEGWWEAAPQATMLSLV